jgi:leader peptidase (prepilin peptidase) / N-methyltransferase
LRQEAPRSAASSAPATDPLRRRSRPTPAPWARHRNILAAAAVGSIALGAVIASVIVAPGLDGMLGAALALLMLAIAAIDGRRFIIPNQLSLATLGLGLLHATLLEPHDVLAALGGAMLRGAVLALMFLALRELYLRLRGREGLGFGDVKLAGAGGVWLGWSMMPVAVEIAALGALAYYGLRHAAGLQAIRASSRIPFGLFLAPAIWLAWLLGALLGID